MERGIRMPWQYKLSYLMGQPIGITFINGQGTSGVLCKEFDGKIQIIEYLYNTQFAIKQYDKEIIQDIHGFPSCQKQPRLH